jgi:hypothetical protein
MAGVVIDQSRIDAPDFPRSQEWWSRFIPMWADATVRDDGTVLLEASGRPHPSEGSQEVTADRARSQAGALDQWIRSVPRLAVAIVEASETVGGKAWP